MINNNCCILYVQGSLGVVTELTLQCIPSMRLREFTSAFNRDSVSKEHIERLKRYRHVRYMWIPYTPTVISVVSNPVQQQGNIEHVSFPTSVPSTAVTASAVLQASAPASTASFSTSATDSVTSAELPTKELSDLFIAIKKESNVKVDEKLVDSINGMSFSQLRDSLLDHAPLDLEHVKKVNKAEASFWEKSCGVREDDRFTVVLFFC